MRGAAVPDEAVTSIARRFAEIESDVVPAMLARYQDEIPEYATLDGQVLADVERVTRANTRALVHHLIEGTIFTSEVSITTREGAVRRAAHGVSLEAFLHACRLWGRIFWETVLAICDPADPAQREAALRIAGRVMDHVDALALAATRAYVDGARSQWSEREVIQGDLLDTLISGRARAEVVERKLKALKLRSAESYVVVLARAADRDEATPERMLAGLRQTLGEARTRLRPQQASLLVGVRSSEVVALYPVSGQQALDACRDEATVFADALGAANSRVGVGGWHQGLSGVAVSYAEAREAVAVALAPGCADRIVRFDDIVVDHMLRSSPGAHALLRDTVAQIKAYDARRQSELMRTLEAYLDNGGNITRTARALHVHPNTVVYRLRRIGEIAGRDPARPQDLLVLSLAVRLDTIGDQPRPGREDGGAL
jgi:sugar diacid utilization regulator